MNYFRERYNTAIDEKLFLTDIRTVAARTRPETHKAIRDIDHRLKVLQLIIIWCDERATELAVQQLSLTIKHIKQLQTA